LTAQRVERIVISTNLRMVKVFIALLSFVVCISASSFKRKATQTKETRVGSEFEYKGTWYSVYDVEEKFSRLGYGVKPCGGEGTLLKSMSDDYNYCMVECLQTDTCNALAFDTADFKCWLYHKEDVCTEDLCDWGRPDKNNFVYYYTGCKRAVVASGGSGATLIGGRFWAETKSLKAVNQALKKALRAALN